MTDVAATERRRRYRPPREADVKAARLLEATEGMAEWRKEAACRNADPALFIPDHERPDAQAAMETAKRICADCSSRGPCLAYALAMGEPGVWGGTDDNDRRRMFRQSRSTSLRLRQVLRAEGLTYPEAGRLMGAPEQTVMRWCNGYNEPPEWVRAWVEARLSAHSALG